MNKGVLSPLCSGTCCYTGHFLHLIEVFWLKFMFSPCIPCSPELLQTQALYTCLWINPCCTFVVRKHSFSHPQKRGRKVQWWFRGVKHGQWELHMKILVSYDQFAWDHSGGLDQAQEQNLCPRVVLSPPGPPSSVARPHLLILFLNHISFLVLHQRSIRCTVSGRSCPPQRNSMPFQACSLVLVSVAWIILQGDIYILKHTAW